MLKRVLKCMHRANYRFKLPCQINIDNSDLEKDNTLRKVADVEWGLNWCVGPIKDLKAFLRSILSSDFQILFNE